MLALWKTQVAAQGQWARSASRLVCCALARAVVGSSVAALPVQRVHAQAVRAAPYSR